MNETRWRRIQSSARRLAARLAPTLLAGAMGVAAFGSYLGIVDRASIRVDEDWAAEHPDWQTSGDPFPLEEGVSGWGEVLVGKEADILPFDPLHPMVLVGLPTAIGLAMLVGFAVAVRHRKRWPLLTVTLVGWLIAGMWPAVMLVTYEIGVRERRVRRLWWAAGIGAAVVGGPLLVTGGVRWGLGEAMVAGVLAAGALVALPMLLGLWLSTRRRLLVELRERVERAELEQRARAEQARVEERARIAREMHDVVAHRVSLMVLHAGGVEVSSTDERSARSAALIRGTGREALTELRDMLWVLNEPDGENGVPMAPVPTLADLDRLLDQARAAGIRVARRDEGSLDGLPAAVGRTAYRVVREGLTNVARHAGQADVEVTLCRQPAALLVRVHNGQPSEPPAAPPASGYGLVGLRERVELLGGTVAAAPAAGGGFTLHVRLPLGPEADDALGACQDDPR